MRFAPFCLLALSVIAGARDAAAADSYIKMLSVPASDGSAAVVVTGTILESSGKPRVESTPVTKNGMTVLVPAGKGYTVLARINGVVTCEVKLASVPATVVFTRISATNPRVTCSVK